MAHQTVQPQPQPRQYTTVDANDNSRLILGDVYNYGVLFGTAADEQAVKGFGLCLASAPTIPTNNFIGRVAELDYMTTYFQPGKDARIEQKRLALGGMGGVGKTQLSLAFVRLHSQSYTSVFWLNATTELSLMTSFRSIASLLVKAQERSELSDEQIVFRCHEWLSNLGNKHWLLIFDNYDDPELFDISNYYPLAGHGSILITTRRPDAVNDEVLRLQPLANLEDCLKILEVRSRRSDVRQDPYARLLVERLGGFPLALVTAGAHLSKSTLSFEQYLCQYDKCWNLDPRRPLRLAEYRDRSLHTTWNLSYSRLVGDDADAARMLHLLAYFDNQDIWYELLHAGLTDNLPDWLRATLNDQFTFDSVMRTLLDYCFVEVNATTHSYSLHICIHDWTLGELNRDIEPSLYWYAFDCVAAKLSYDMNRFNPLLDRRPVRHVVRLINSHFDSNKLFQNISSDRLNSAYLMGALLTGERQFAASERFLLRVQRLSADGGGISLRVLHRLAVLYNRQGRIAETEEVLLQAHSAWKGGAPISDELVAEIHRCLGILYSDQDKQAEAEKMLLQAVTLFEALAEPSQHLILNTLICLGVVYQRQDKHKEAETVYAQVLEKSETLLGSEHNSTLTAANNLAMVWLRKDKFDEAERELTRILAIRKNNFDRLHDGTLVAMRNMALIHRRQGRFDSARSLYEELLPLREEASGPNHIETIKIVDALGMICYFQHDFDVAERLWQRALSGFRKFLPPDHIQIVVVIENLEDLHRCRNEMENAKSLAHEACEGLKHKSGPSPQYGIVVPAAVTNPNAA